MVYKLIIILVLSLSIASGQTEGAKKKCYQCNSSTEPKCITDLKSLEPTDCKDDSYKYCVTSVAKNGTVTRECAVTECDSSDANCKSTSEDGSNKHNVCQGCSSSTDVKCAQSGDVVTSFNKICDAEDTKCFVKIKDKNTERGCATNDDIKTCETDTETCKTCSEGSCNFGIFPTNRLYCYQCNDNKCNDVIDNDADIKSLPCQFYDKNDKCYQFALSSTENMKRGCVSDSTENDNKCTSPDSTERCLTCDKSNCNNENYLREQKLKCIQCSSSESDLKCTWGQNSNDAKNCKNKIEYYREEKCYTQLTNGSVYRGCFYDREENLGECKEDCDTCTKSDGDGCNNKDKPGFTCIRCRSDVNEKCIDDAKSINGSECRNVVTSDDIGCFHGKWNGVVIRGCYVDAEVSVQATCKDPNNHQCNFCNTKDCNNADTSASAANRLRVFSAIILVSLILFIQKF